MSKMMMSSSALALLLCAVGGMNAARAASGFGAGNGGDGLEMSSPVSKPADVTVPIPSDLGDSGLLEVMGTAGAGQGELVNAFYCKNDSLGRPSKYGCSFDKPISIELNQSISLSAGLYFLTYSGSGTLVGVQKNEKSVVRLQKITIAKKQSQIGVEVFLDLTDTSMQDFALLSIFSDSSYESQDKSLCSPPSVDFQAYCSAAASDNYLDLLNKQIRFNVDGSYSSFDYGGFRVIGRLYVSPSQGAPFVSVFPGVYGIVFTDNQTGQTETKYGIHVE
jgi:hypothetical protein